MAHYWCKSNSREQPDWDRDLLHIFCTTTSASVNLENSMDGTEITDIFPVFLFDVFKILRRSRFLGHIDVFMDTHACMAFMVDTCHCLLIIRRVLVDLMRGWKVWRKNCLDVWCHVNNTQHFKVSPCLSISSHVNIPPYLNIPPDFNSSSHQNVSRLANIPIGISNSRPMGYSDALVSSEILEH